MKAKPIDWKSSNNYMQFLATFQTPHDAHKVMRWSWPTHDLHIKPTQIIEQWVQEGILVNATPEEALGKIFQAAQLKTLLKEIKLPVSGSKIEMIDRLLEFNRPKMNEIISRSQVLKCSDETVKIITAYREQIQHEMDLAKQKSFEALKIGDYKGACKIFTNYQRRISNSKYEMYSFYVDEVGFALSAKPTVLSSLKPEDLKVLNTVACMQILWGADSPDRWIPEGFKTHYENIQTPINYILVNAKIKRDISFHKESSKQVAIHFDSGDIDSCSLCLTLDGKIFEIKDIPDLPMQGCTSFTGCKCKINSTDKDDEFSEFDDELEGEENVIDLSSEQDSSKNPVELLRTLKQMLDENLITRAEYEEKKKDLLSRM